MRWGLEQGDPGEIPEPHPHLLFVESLSSLPKSLRSISLELPMVGLLPNLFTFDVILEFWEAFDKDLGGPKFSHLTCAELLWSIWSPSRKPIVDKLCDMLKKGDFARYMPNLYKRGILRCGDRGQRVRRVYPISEPSVALAARDREAWKDSYLPRMFSYDTSYPSLR